MKFLPVRFLSIMFSNLIMKDNLTQVFAAEQSPINNPGEL